MTNPALTMNDFAALEASPEYRPQVVDDVQVSPFSQQQTNQYVVGRAASSSFLRTNVIGVRILELLNGQRSIEQLQTELQQRYNINVSLEKIRHFCDLCARHRLLVHETWANTTPDSADAPRLGRRSGLYWTLIRGDAVIDRVVAWRRWWWNPATWLLIVGLLGVGLSYIIAKGVILVSPLMLAHPDANKQLIFWIFGLFLAEIATHELAHAVACKMAGAKPAGFGMGLLWWFIPIFFTDTSDIYRVSSKYKRASVAAAGPLVDALWFGVIASLLWLLPSDSLIYTIALAYSGIPALLFLINLNPFVSRMDGYWIMTNLLEQPNLRQRTVRNIGNKVRAWFGRAPIIDPLSEQQTGRWQWAYNLYALVSLIWTIFFVANLGLHFASYGLTIVRMYAAAL
ncbi:M50 family metallopeptidase [Herpetosiphon llansteffanensis]